MCKDLDKDMCMQQVQSCRGNRAAMVQCCFFNFRLLRQSGGVLSRRDAIQDLETMGIAQKELWHGVCTPWDRCFGDTDDKADGFLC